MPNYSKPSNYDMSLSSIGALAAQVISAKYDLSSMNEDEIMRLYCLEIDRLFDALERRSLIRK